MRLLKHAGMVVFAFFGAIFILMGVFDRGAWLAALGVIFVAPGAVEIAPWARRRVGQMTMVQKLKIVAGCVAVPFFAILVGALNGAKPSSTTTTAPNGGFRLDTLDVLPARAGDLRIATAWRVSAAGITENFGTYHWYDGATGDVELMCVTPALDILDCDKSLPKRFDLNGARACGFSTYDQDTGPCVFWPGCHLCAARAPRVKGVFERLKDASRSAQAWEERYRHAASGGDLSGFSINRDDGLSAASRLGPVDRGVP